jgi:hypothetical protein
VDYGVNSSFNSEDLAQCLAHPLQDTTPTRFVAANGAPLTSSKLLPKSAMVVSRAFVHV